MKRRSELSREYDRKIYYINSEGTPELIEDLPKMDIREIREEALEKVNLLREEFRKFLTKSNRQDILDKVNKYSDEELLNRYHPYLPYLPKEG